MDNDTELFDLCKAVYEATGWDNNASTRYQDRLRVWQQGYSISEMGEGHWDYDSTPPEERNKVNVYDWEARDDPRHKITTGQEVFKWWYSKVHELEQNVIPLYTSDYLLEKLPKSVTSIWGPTYPVSPELQYIQNSWCAFYSSEMTGEHNDDELFNKQADTPLKALLKLTLALHERGLLNHE